MAKKMLIDATHAEETRVVVVDGNKVEEFDFESENKRQLAGNIYLAKVTRVEPSLQAAFVDYGGNRHGFLAFSEIHPDYYQIPVADRQALMAEEEALAAAAADDDEKEKPKRTRSRSRKKPRTETKADTAEADAPTAETEADQPKAADAAVAAAPSREISGMETIDLSDEDDAEASVTGVGAPGEGLSPMETVADTPVAEPVEAPADAPEAEDAPAAAAEDAPSEAPVEETAPVEATAAEDDTVVAEATAEETAAVEVPSDEASVEAAAEDTPADSADETVAEAEEADEDAPKPRPMAESSNEDTVSVSADPDEVTGEPEVKAEAPVESAAEAPTEAVQPESTEAAPVAAEPVAEAVEDAPAAAETASEPAEEAAPAVEEPAPVAEAAAEASAEAVVPASEDVIEGSAVDVTEETSSDDDADEAKESPKKSAAARDSSIESVADDDTEEDIRPARKPRPRRYKIQEVIKVRQILLVQVVKEERGNKGAALTTYLSLAGRYCVLMPNTARGGGISRKITNAADRSKLKTIANEIDVPKGAGLIIRTAGAKRTKTEIKRDYEYLQRLWEQIRELTLKSVAPAKIYEEGDLIKRSIRDLYSREIDEVLVEGERGYRTAKDFMKMIMPSHAKNVQQYTDAMPLFARYQVESYLGGMFNPTVQLKSGGYIVIGVTEALVAIDVNSGRATKEGSIEETATKTNLEAAEEVARQLRLRDLAGLIVIDFIDMDERKNNTAVEKRLKDKLKTDRARIQVGRISGFGLLEMSRQRLRPGMIEATTQPCSHCHGTGLIRSDDSMALQVLRQIEEEGTRRRTREVLVKCPVSIANYLMNQKREHIAQIEVRYGMSVRIEGDPHLVAPDFSIETFKTATRVVPVAQAPVVSVDTSLMDLIDEEAAETEEAEASSEAKEAAPTPETDEGEGEGDRPKKRRRRRRRKGKPTDAVEGAEDNGDAAGETTPAADAPAEEQPATEEGAAETAAPEGAEGEDKPKKRRRSRSRSRRKSNEVKSEDQAEAADAPAETGAEQTEAPAVDAAAPDAPVAETPAVEAVSETVQEAPKAAEAEVKADEAPQATEAAPQVEEPQAQEPAAETPVEQAAAEPAAEPENAKPKRTRVKASDVIAQVMANVEPAAEAPVVEEPATEAPVAEAVVSAEPEPAKAEEASQPKRKGWWSLGR